MNHPRWFRLLAVPAVMSAVVFGACGGDDDDAIDGGTDDGGGSSADVSGNDEKYVAALCQASLDFSDAFLEVLSNPDNAGKSEAEALKLFAEPFEQFVDDLDDANPPKDARKYHDDMVEALRKNVKGLKDGDPDAVAELADTSYPDPPGHLEARLQKAAAENEDCREANVTFKD